MSHLYPGVGQGHAIGVHPVERVGRQRAGHGAAGEHGGGKARSFLITERDDLDRKGHVPTSALQRIDGLDCQHHAKRPIITPAIAHAVEVAADQQHRRCWISALIPPDQIGGRIAPDLHPRFGHPARQRGLCFDIGGGQISAIEPAGQIGIRRHAQRLTPGNGARATGGDRT